MSSKQQSCQDHLDIVMKWAGKTGSKGKRARDSFNHLIENGCREELKIIIDEWTGKTGSKGKFARKAHDKL